MMIVKHPVNGPACARVFGIAALLCLTACNNAADKDGGAETDRNARAGQIPSNVVLPLQPGLWQRTVEFGQIKVPGLSEKKKRGILARMSKAASQQICLTPKQAPRPPADFFGGGTKGACKYRSFSAQENGVKMLLSCDMDGMAVAEMDIGGHIDAAQFDFDVATELRLPMAGKVQLTGTSQGRFMGACGG